jgi:hypothetical protein
MAEKLLDGGKMFSGGLERPRLVQMYIFCETPQLGGFRIHVALAWFIRKTPILGGFRLGLGIWLAPCGVRWLPPGPLPQCSHIARFTMWPNIVGPVHYGPGPTSTNIFCFPPRGATDAPTRIIASKIHQN